MIQVNTFCTIYEFLHTGEEEEDVGQCDQFLKPLATINLPKSPTFLGNFCNGVKIYHFSSEIIFGQLL